jgi:hypothetical protein
VADKFRHPRAHAVTQRKAQSLITPQLMALTSGDNLHIIGVTGRRAIHCEPMASNIMSERSIELRRSILCSAPTLCRSVGSAGQNSQRNSL